jgi:aldehyde dehydrogenase (NAD+)
VKLAELFEKNADLLASVEALDNGKAFSMARNADVPGCAGCLRYYGGWADKIEGKVVDTSPDKFNYIRKEPVSLDILSVRQTTMLMNVDWRLRSNHSLELPPPHVGMEDWPRHCGR